MKPPERVWFWFFARFRLTSVNPPRTKPWSMRCLLWPLSMGPLLCTSGTLWFSHPWVKCACDRQPETFLSGCFVVQMIVVPLSQSLFPKPIRAKAEDSVINMAMRLKSSWFVNRKFIYFNHGHVSEASKWISSKDKDFKFMATTEWLVLNRGILNKWTGEPFTSTTLEKNRPLHLITTFSWRNRCHTCFRIDFDCRRTSGAVIFQEWRDRSWHKGNSPRYRELWVPNETTLKVAPWRPRANQVRYFG